MPPPNCRRCGCVMVIRYGMYDYFYGCPNGSRENPHPTQNLPKKWETRHLRSMRYTEKHPLEWYL